MENFQGKNHLCTKIFQKERQKVLFWSYGLFPTSWLLSDSETKREKAIKGWERNILTFSYCFSNEHGTYAFKCQANTRICWEKNTSVGKGRKSPYSHFFLISQGKTRIFWGESFKGEFFPLNFSLWEKAGVSKLIPPFGLPSLGWESNKSQLLVTCLGLLIGLIWRAAQMVTRSCWKLAGKDAAVHVKKCLCLESGLGLRLLSLLWTISLAEAPLGLRKQKELTAAVGLGWLLLTSLSLHPTLLPEELSIENQALGATLGLAIACPKLLSCVLLGMSPVAWLCTLASKHSAVVCSENWVWHFWAPSLGRRWELLTAFLLAAGTALPKSFLDLLQNKDIPQSIATQIKWVEDVQWLPLKWMRWRGSISAGSCTAPGFSACSFSVSLTDLGKITCYCDFQRILREFLNPTEIMCGLGIFLFQVFWKILGVTPLCWSVVWLGSVVQILFLKLLRHCMAG